MTPEAASRRAFLKFAALSIGVSLCPGLALADALKAVASATTGSDKDFPYRVGKWLPSDQAHLDAWMRKHIQDVDAKPGIQHPVIEEFKNLIETDPVVFMLFHQMFEEIPKNPHYRKTPTGVGQIRDYKHMLLLINAIMTTAPEFSTSGLVGFPINAILDWPMGTGSGSAAFLNDKVNAQLKKVLNEWGRFLQSKESRYVLSDDPRSGWFGKGARKAMPNFTTEYVCDPGKPYHGFASWDDFFTRRFREGQRPVASPGNDAVIVNACESAPYKIARNVKRQDRFWIKSQPYSLIHMMAGDGLTDQFVGGTIYQAFLSALSYHRWHSPVSGKIVKAYVKDGSYYAEAMSMGFDPAGPNNSQSFITDVATRALIFIEADNPAIGLMCFMAIGMAEVSTCEITVQVGQRVQKGEQLGMFHFGGSTHCLIFRPQVRIEFDLHGQTPGLHSNNIKVNSKIATVLS